MCIYVRVCVCVCVMYVSDVHACAAAGAYNILRVFDYRVCELDFIANYVNCSTTSHQFFPFTRMAIKRRRQICRI